MSEPTPKKLSTRIEADLQPEFKKRNDKRQEARAKAGTGDFQGAVTLLQNNLGWCEQNLGEDHEMTVWHLEELAIQLANLERLAEAFDSGDRAYRIRKRFDAESRDALLTLSNLAYVSQRLGRLELAAEHYDLLWNSQKKKLGDSHEETLRAAAGLAGCWQRMYKANSDKKVLKKATQLHSDVLQARTKQEPQSLERLVQSREDLGMDYISDDKLSKAKELFSKNIEELNALPAATSVDVVGLKDRNSKFLELIAGKESEAKAKRVEERRRRNAQEEKAKKEKELQEKEKRKITESTKNSDAQAVSSSQSKSSTNDLGLSAQSGKNRPHAASETNTQGDQRSDKERDRKRPASVGRNTIEKIVPDKPEIMGPSASDSKAGQPFKTIIRYKIPDNVVRQQDTEPSSKAKEEKKDIKGSRDLRNSQKTALPAIIIQDTNPSPSTTEARPDKGSQPDRASSVPPDASRRDPKIGRSTSTREKSDSKLETKSDVGASSDREQLPNGKQIKRKRKSKQGAIFDAKIGRAGDPTVEDWFDRIQEINEDLLDNIRKSKGSRVKIAVLDTGIDLNHKLFQEKRSKRRIRKCEDFLGDGEASDLCGHGTHCVQLIMKIAPEADIYVARCVKDFDTDPDEIAITRAIYRACRPVKEGDAKVNWDVDIISLSLGFYSYQWAIGTALKEVTQRNKLLFAAASNNGLRRQMTFPASEPEAICINAADGNGSPLALNPPFKPEKPLTILGENVESAWKCEPGSNGTLKVMTGTSVATPIAAAVAALMLEIAMMPSNGKAESVFKRCLPYMRQNTGMTAILKDMSVERNSFSTIIPWNRLYHDSNSDQEGGDEFEETMIRLALNSEQVLRRVYGSLKAPPNESRTS